MAKTSAILLSIALALSTCTAVLAQARDVRENRDIGTVPAHDPLDDIYDQINAQARASAQPNLNPNMGLRDRRAYDQFMQQTSGNLMVEYGNTAQLQNARRRDALTTGGYEQKRINELADYEKSQLQNTGQYSKYGRALRSPRYNSQAADELRNVENYRTQGLSRSQDATDSRMQENAAYWQSRDQSMRDVAENLRDQVLSTQSSDKAFGLQGVGTNLYTRQYGKPEAVLPPVHSAAARIVPLNGGD